jgi:hypothetical protein
MFSFEALREKTLLFLDALYIRTEADASSPGTSFSGADFNTKTATIQLAYGKRIAVNPRGATDAFVGVRYWSVKNTLELEAGTLPAVTVAQRKDWVDPILGARWSTLLSPKWRGVFSADLGGFGVGANFTWQLFAAFTLEMSPKSALVIGYRYLDVDYDSGGFVYDVALDGPLIGYQFRF